MTTCPECCRCPECGNTWCLSEVRQAPCPHGIGVCGPCWPNGCRECEEEAMADELA